MKLFGWLFGTREIPGHAQAEFDHPKVYGEVESGPGVAAASRAAANWRDRVSAAFGAADGDLDRVLKKFDVVMQGAAGEQAKDAVTPLSQVTRQSIEVAAQVGAAVEQQAQGSADFKYAFPPPFQVPPDNIGWTDYVNPIAYGFKTEVRAAHEEHHHQVEAQARQQYESYTRASNDRANTVQRFEPPPTFIADIAPADTAPVHKVDPNTGYTGATTTTPTSTGQPSSDRTGSPTEVPSRTPGQPIVPNGQSMSPVPQSPAESGSAWATSPAAGTTPLPGTGVPTSPGVGGGGFVGGAVIPRGSTSGPGVAGRVGGGTGTGRGVGGLGGSALGPGGSSGGGGSTPGGAAAGGNATRRGGAGAAAGGAGAGRGKREDEDKEHVNKYVAPTDDAWGELGLPKTAPPVFGDWAAQDQEGKPPRPPEKGAP